MGRPSASKPYPKGYQDEFRRDDGASASSAISLHSDVCFENADDIPELPPYTDDVEDDGHHIDSSPYDQAPLLSDKRIEQYETNDYKGTSLIRLSPVLTADPIALKAYLLAQAKQELRAHVRITGTHQETNRISDKKTEKKTVTDFCFSIDVTDTISRRRQGEECWSSLGIVSNERKTYRASILKRRDKRFEADVESANETASLDEWCHLFCASNSKLKTFTMRRIITNRDDKLLRDNIEAIIRGSRYRGTITVGFPTSIRSVSITTPHWINKLRTNIYVWWACVILQLWILTWPLLILMTKRWDIVEVRFPFKRVDARTGIEEYVCGSEDEWCAKWAYTIRQSCLRRVGSAGSGIGGQVCQVRLVDEEVERSKNAQRERERDSQIPQGRGWGGAMGLVRGGLAVAQEWRDDSDWGFDES